jgi:hypothetical protein
VALQHWMTYECTDIFRVDASAYTYKTSNMTLDADGSPRAYNPGDTGLDANANAGFPHGGWRSVLVADPNDHSRPYVQPAGPNQGFFVSMTTLHDPNPTVPDTDPAKYVDAETFPYIVFAGGFFAIQGTGGWGDVVLARSLTTARQSAALVGDEGGTNEPLGEISLSLAVRLGGHNPNPRTGAGSPPGPFQYLVFPKSHRDPRWPRSMQDVEQQAASLLQTIGGWPDV